MVSTDTSGPADQVVTSGDPLTALLDAASAQDCLALLPAAVSRAAELAEKMRLSIQLRSGSTDPLLVALVAAMELAAAAHEHFVSTWLDTSTLSELDEEALKNGVDTLNRTHDTLFDAAIETMPPA